MINKYIYIYAHYIVTPKRSNAVLRLEHLQPGEVIGGIWGTSSPRWFYNETAMWGRWSIAKLVYNSNNYGYGTYNYSYGGL